MVNAHRGEIAATLDGHEYRLCLTLGALAELEHAFRADDLGQLVERFSSGKLSAGDMIRIIGAGLRAGGTPLNDDEVAGMGCEGGAAGYARIVSDLLTASFGGRKDEPANP
jgi:predicted naringenin-chalcone synthase